ncbi:thiamine biosynthesis lipoprotein [Rugamonas rubra]|uniref:FAD:protein FMN transferase n=2 Tax=Rugamonas rubra TaxID=758825 RepID=A0A1I4P1K0_9BURK|nr:thiamine biosynthesis lipoprotein [Rugamonas rubra]
MRRYSLNGETMGTRYSAVFYAPGQVDLAAIDASLFAAVDKVDRQMSTWNPASDLCRLNAAPEDVWLAVPPELAHVLDAGLRVGRQSNGAFDMGLGQLVDDWGFGPAQRTPSPQLATLRQGAAGPADDALEVDMARLQVRKRAPLALDLSAIAKGYGVDQLAHCLDGHGIASYLVGIDGEMRARAAKPGGDAWAVAIEKPVFGSREVAGVMELHDTAIATSGDYRRWVDVAGVRYSHTMHPALRRPLSNQLAAVTVLAPTCMQADAWATALMVLGPIDGVALARKKGMDALFVLRDGAGFQEILIGGDALRP